MADMLNTAVSGLLSYQRALSTTSHNIANVNTPGYSRQSAELATNLPTQSGNWYYGNGVQVASITRAYDQFLTQDMRETASSFSRTETFSQFSGRIDDVLADTKGGIAPAINDFFASVQGVTDDPTSNTARLVMINSAQSFVNRYENIDQHLDQLSASSSAQVTRVVGEINDIVVAIRDVNIALNNANVTGDDTQQSADMLDRRDALLTQLAEKVNISVVEEANNQLSIFIGNGQTMLSGNQAFSLSAQPDLSDPSRDAIVYNGVISVFDMSSQLNGGELGGLLDFRQNVLVPARNALGRSAIGVAETFNAQMRDGMDLNGNLGSDLFSYNNPEVIPHGKNTGAGTVSALISDVTALTTDDYNLTLSGATWTLTSTSGNSTTVANGAPATLVFEGLTFTINGGAALSGDQFKIKPTLGGAASLQVINTNPKEIAAAAPIRTSAALSNLGSLDISAGVVTDVTNPNLLTAATFTFDTPATTFTSNVDVVVGGTTITAGSAVAFSNNMIVDANGWRVQLKGQPQGGDTFSVQSNSGGVGDNRNGLKLANLQNKGIFEGGIESFQENYATLVGFVGAQTKAANAERDAHQSLLTQAEDRIASKTSVNLDEEAADLIRFQQAYEASARVIGTIQTLFDSLLQSMR